MGGITKSGAEGLQAMHASFLPTQPATRWSKKGTRKSQALHPMYRGFRGCTDGSSEVVWEKQVVMQLSEKVTRGASTTEGLSSGIASAWGREI